MAKPKHPVAVHSAAPHRTVFRPALRSYEQAFDQALCHPPVVSDERQIDVDQRVGFREPLPGRSNAAKAAMIHSSWRSRSACAFKYSSCGTSPPPALNWIVSSGYNGSRVRSAKRLASVDFPPPAFPNTATLFIGVQS